MSGFEDVLKVIDAGSRIIGPLTRGVSAFSNTPTIPQISTASLGPSAFAQLSNTVGARRRATEGFSATGASLAALGNRLRGSTLPSRARTAFDALSSAAAGRRGAVLDRGATGVQDIANLRSSVVPGEGLFTTGVRRARDEAVGTVRENLRRRRVLGASFAEAEQARTKAEFATAENAALAQEVGLSADLIAQEQEIANQAETLSTQLLQFEGNITDASLTRQLQAELGLGEAETRALQARLEATRQEFLVADAELQRTLEAVGIDKGIAANIQGLNSQIARANLSTEIAASNARGQLLESLPGSVTSAISGARDLAEVFGLGGTADLAGATSISNSGGAAGLDLLFGGGPPPGTTAALSSLLGGGGLASGTTAAAGIDAAVNAGLAAVPSSASAGLASGAGAGAAQAAGFLGTGLAAGPALFSFGPLAALPALALAIGGRDKGVGPNGNVVLGNGGNIRAVGADNGVSPARMREFGNKISGSLKSAVSEQGGSIGNISQRAGIGFFQGKWFASDSQGREESFLRAEEAAAFYVAGLARDGSIAVSDLPKVIRAVSESVKGFQARPRASRAELANLAPEAAANFSNFAGR